MSQKLIPIAVGADPELFFLSKITGNPLPVIGLLGGTKKNPKPVLGGKGFAIQEDNVAAEFNIPPAFNRDDFSKSIEDVLNLLQKEAEKSQAKLHIVPSCHFDPKQLEHPQAANIGCEPDFCVWTRTINEFGEEKREALKTLRSSGGHVHISFKEGKSLKPSIESQELVVMMMDAFLGVPSVLMDNDKERASLYGKSGAFRPKEWGVEYRVLSNFWIKSEVLRKWVFSSATAAVHHCNEGPYVRILVDNAKKIQECINNRDKTLAHYLINSFALALPERF